MTKCSRLYYHLVKNMAFKKVGTHKNLSIHYLKHDFSKQTMRIFPCFCVTWWFWRPVTAWGYTGAAGGITKDPAILGAEVITVLDLTWVVHTTFGWWLGQMWPIYTHFVIKNNTQTVWPKSQRLLWKGVSKCVSAPKCQKNHVCGLCRRCRSIWKHIGWGWRW